MKGFPEYSRLDYSYSVILVAHSFSQNGKIRRMVAKLRLRTRVSAFPILPQPNVFANPNGGGL